MKDLKPLVTLRVKDGVAYVSQLKEPNLIGVSRPSRVVIERDFENSFVQVANPEILTAWPFGNEVDKAFHHALYKPVDGTYNVSDKQMVFSVEEKCCLNNYNEISETYYCQSGGCAKQKCAIVSISNNEVDMSKWYCEEHPDKDMGHDGCSGAGVLESARIPLLVLRNRLLKQELREVKSQHGMDVINLKDCIISSEKDNSSLPEKKEVGSEQPYFKLGKNDGGKGFLYYMPGNGGYKCWMPIDDELYTHLEKALKH